MTVSGILFDLDGTLVDSLPGIEYSIRAAVHQVLPDRESDGVRKWIGPPIRAMFRRAFADLDDSTLDDLERAFRRSYDSEGWQRTVAYNGVASTLARLAARKVRSFVITNKPWTPTQRILGQLQLSQFFTGVATLDSQSPPFGSKAEVVSYLLSRYALDAGQAFLVGDSEDDARAAQANGLRFLAVAYGYGSAHQSERPDRVLTGFESLPECLAAFR